MLIHACLYTDMYFKKKKKKYTKEICFKHVASFISYYVLC